MRSKRAAGYIGAGLVPLRVSGDGVAAISALTEEQVTAFDGFSRLAAPVGAGRLVLVFGGPLDTVRDVLAWPDAVEGAEYYLSLTGPVLRSELTEATWSRLVGIGQAGGSIVTRVGAAFEYSAEADPFVPADDDNWDTPPASDGAALDELAVRVKALEAGGGGGAVGPMLSQSFVAEAGQTEFVITDSGSVSCVENVLVGGVPLPGWTEALEALTVTMPEEIPAGMAVVIMYRE